MISKDIELLRQYAECGSEESFTILVERHRVMVFGVAIRMVRDVHLAEEVTQAVFVILARKASRLKQGTLLGGWLHNTTRFVALESLRKEQRVIKQRELLNEIDSESHSVWEQIVPALDYAIGRLGQQDREAIISRFLEGKTFAEVAESSGTSEAAAKMRVGRSLEKLRVLLNKQGVALPIAALSTALATHAASVTPPAAAALASVACSNSISHLGVGSLIEAGTKALGLKMAKTYALFLTLGLGIAVSAGILWQQVAEPAPVHFWVSPVAGEWKGTLTSKGDALPGPNTQQATLTITLEDQGRLCKIEMRVSNSGQPGTNTFRFSHKLDEAGSQITTMDDPQVGLLNGPGKISEHKGTGLQELTLAFKTPHSNGGGNSECRWQLKGNELTIIREDKMQSPQGLTTLISELKLKRR